MGILIIVVMVKFINIFDIKFVCLLVGVMLVVNKIVVVK